MLIFFLILTSTLLSGILSPKTEEEIAVASKEVSLHSIYKEYWNNVLQGIKPSKQSSSKAKFKLIPITDVQLWAAFHERYTAVRLNMLCWNCALFYTVGAATPNEEKARKCEKQGTVLSWYNEHFSAKSFLEVYSSKSDEHIKQTAQELDNVLSNLHKMNKIFIKANLNYNNIFAKLKKTKTVFSYEWNGESIELKGGDFAEESQKILLDVIGSEFFVLSNTISVLLQSSENYIEFDDLVIPFEDVTRLWDLIAETEPFHEQFSDVQRILSLEEQIYRLGFEGEEIKISTEWEITSVGLEGVLGYKLQAKENPKDDQTNEDTEEKS